MIYQKIIQLTVFLLIFIPINFCHAIGVKFNLYPGIEYNFTKSSVLSAQTLLAKKGYLNSQHINSNYGNEMKKAVMEYQKNIGIRQSGVIGSFTKIEIDDETQNGKITSHSKSVLSSNFSTSTKSIKSQILNVPLIEQIYSLSCESASLQMALEYKKVIKNQDEILSEIGVSSPKVKYKNESGDMVWGDPNKGFVGDVKGWMYSFSNGQIGATGWGVNNTPIAKVAKKYRSNSEAITGAHLDLIIKEIDTSNPVIVWRYFSLPENLLTMKKYKAKDGADVNFIQNHVSLVVGYELLDNGKYNIFINDPEYGRIIVDENEFMSTWRKYH